MSAESTNRSTDHEPLGNEETPHLTAQKAVTISDEPEQIPPEQSQPPLPGSSPRLHRASISGKKMTGRPPLTHSQSSSIFSRTLSDLKVDDAPSPGTSTPTDLASSRSDPRNLLAQVATWLKEEKAKRSKGQRIAEEGTQQDISNETDLAYGAADQDLALGKLEKILNSFPGSTGFFLSHADSRSKKPYTSTNHRRGSLGNVFKRTSIAGASSDTEWIDEDINIPHVEARLDNSKTFAFTDEDADTEGIKATQQKDYKYWKEFKQDIIRLLHTLRIRGWRRIPIKQAEIISIQRVSSALTNAVYVVKPPKILPEPDTSFNQKPYISKSRPTELLLRVYGPQVEHLIDREAELGVLRRLARKKIGPRLLGYFTNGRFEEYLHANTLTSKDLRVPETMKQIAKRMREFHDGIDVLPAEREGGPRAFINWNKWVDRAETVANWLDAHVKREDEGVRPPSQRYTKWGFVCGVEWPVFRKAYEKYREMVIHEYGGFKALQKRLVFAHNDTQYGNLMRLETPQTSPLLEPANKHRQLVVIDFEYAGANVPGYEFSDHFSEWCYDYHDLETSYAFHETWYPSVQEQYLSVRSYVMHRSQFVSTASSTPRMEGREKTSIADFMLDARAPLGAPAVDYAAEEKAREEKVESDIQALMREAKLWRTANAAQWIAWGFVQAKIPELDESPKRSKTQRFTDAFDKIKERIHPISDSVDEDVKSLREPSKRDRPEGPVEDELNDEEDPDAEDVEEFDHLGYSHDRALFFWGDCLQLGLVEKEELPESLLKKIKIVDR